MADANNTTDFYVYVHRRSTDGRVFYVGKGNGNRAYTSAGRNRYWHNIVKKHGYTAEIVQDGMQEWWAFELECELIAYYGRDKLANLTDGGDGASGRIVGDNERRLKSERLKGRPLAEETKRKLSIAKIGKPGHKHTPEQRKAISERNKGRKMPWMAGENNHMKKPEYRAMFSELLKGRDNTWMRGDKNHMHLPEHKERIGSRFRGKKRPEITGANHKLSKSIICIETGQEFDSASSAAKWIRETSNHKATSSNITSVCTGSLKSAYGYKWKHK